MNLTVGNPVNILNGADIDGTVELFESGSEIKIKVKFDTGVHPAGVTFTVVFNSGILTYEMEMPSSMQSKDGDCTRGVLQYYFMVTNH